MTYITLGDVNTLAAALSSTRSLPDNHPVKDASLTILEMRVQQSIEELELFGAPSNDPLLIRLRSL